jgi:DNA mismatch repair protein MutS
MKRWVVLPLKNLDQIRRRQGMVRALLESHKTTETLQQQLIRIGDLERLISKAAARRVNPREVLMIGKSLKALIPIKESCLDTNSKELKILGSG